MSEAVQAPTLVKDERQLSFDFFPPFEEDSQKVLEDVWLSADGCRVVIQERSLERVPASIRRIQ